MKFLSKFKLAGLFCLSLLFTLSIFTTQVSANTNLTQLPFYWDDIEVTIDVEDNGDMLVTETQTYVFNQEYTDERYRYIPLDRLEDITDVSVSENNSVVPSQTGKENNRLWIRWQHELNPPESHTFVIKYRVIGGIQVNADDAKVYWKAIFGDRTAPVQNAKVIVRLPESLAGKTHFSNHYAANVRVTSEIGDRTVEFITQQPIPAGKELEVEVGFPNDLNLPKPKWQPGMFGQTNGQTALMEEILMVIAICFPFLLGIYLFITRPASGSKSGSKLRRNSHYYGSNYGGYYGGGSGGYYGGGSGGGGGCSGGDGGGGGGGG